MYHKSDVLYGIFQAKQAIVRNDCCYLVEGYTDVLSMHQAGIENVVASSGTSLTPGQIRLIHRFTNNITVLYDGDAAGIKASIRGIDLILREGLNIKVVLLPDGDDPDSFAKKQSASDFTTYIKSHETDFIRFKTQLLLEGAGSDPIKRAALIGDIVRSIAIIPDTILRSVYVQECARLLEADEKMLMREVNKIIRNNREQELSKKPAPYTTDTQPHNASATGTPTVPQTDETNQPTGTATSTGEGTTDVATLPTSDIDTPVVTLPVKKKTENRLFSECERELIRYILRYGFATMPYYNEVTEAYDSCRVIDYIARELAADNITFTHPLYARMYDEARQILPEAAAEYGELQLAQRIDALQTKRQQELEALTQADEKLIASIDERFHNDCNAIRYEAEASYIGHHFINSPDNEISLQAADLISDRHQLSKIHTKFQVVAREIDTLGELIPRAIFELKDTIVVRRIDELRNELRTTTDEGKVTHIMEEIAQYMEVRKELARYLGERIVTPKG